MTYSTVHPAIYLYSSITNNAIVADQYNFKCVIKAYMCKCQRVLYSATGSSVRHKFSTQVQGNWCSVEIAWGHRVFQTTEFPYPFLVSDSATEEVEKMR